MRKYITYNDISFQLHCYNSKAPILSRSHMTPLLLHKQAHSVASTLGRNIAIKDFVIFQNVPGEL
jgi:hypothetical protein